MSTVLSMRVMRLVGRTAVPGSQIQDVITRASRTKGAMRAAHVGRYRESKNIHTMDRSSVYASKRSHGRGKLPEGIAEALLRIKSRAAGRSRRPGFPTALEACTV